MAAAAVFDLKRLRARSSAAYTTKQDYAAALLREAIVSGVLPPGQHLRQEEVAGQLGLSWTPIREAFRLLEAEGWLVVERHRGAVVSSLSLRDFEEIYVLRLANEPLAARLSAEVMTDATLARMRDLAEQIRRIDVSRPEDWVRSLALEREFHHAQYLAANRPRLLEIVLGLRDASDRYLRASLAIGDEPAQHRQVHARLLRACRARDGAAAEATIRAALERVLVRVRPLLADALASATPPEPVHT